jgi:hypothetical protein
MIGKNRGVLVLGAAAGISTLRFPEIARSESQDCKLTDGRSPASYYVVSGGGAHAKAHNPLRWFECSCPQALTLPFRKEVGAPGSSRLSAPDMHGRPRRF